MTDLPERTTFTPAERDAIYRVIRQRRNILHGLSGDPIPAEILTRILAAAHAAPSPAQCKPWDFIIVASSEGRAALHRMVRRRQDAHRATLTPTRAAAYDGLRSEAIIDTPVTVAVTADPTTGGHVNLGADDFGENLVRSVSYAVENLWLAAQAEHIGVCVSGVFDPDEAARVLGVPPHMQVLLLLSLGHVDRVAAVPSVAQAGWSRGKPLAWAVHQERYGQRGLPSQPPSGILDETLAAIEPLPGGPRDDQLTRLAVLTGQPATVLSPALLVLFVAGGGDDPAGRSMPAVMAAMETAHRVAEEVGAEAGAIDLAPAGATPVPGALHRPLGTAGERLDPELVRQAVEIGVGTAREAFASGNCCLAAEIIMAVPAQPDATPILTVAAAASPAEIYGLLAAADRPELAALAGLILGARALRLPILLSGDTGTTAAAIAARLHPGTRDACFHATRDPAGRVQVHTTQPRAMPTGSGLAAAGIGLLGHLLEVTRTTAH
jgi:nicotinate-nucleotide--dimethylbenzimidazole phosphoribosyltransferase